MQNPNLWDRITYRFRTAVIGMFLGKSGPEDSPAAQHEAPEEIRVAAE